MKTIRPGCRPIMDPLVWGPIDRAMFSAEFGLTAEALRKGGRDLLKEARQPRPNPWPRVRPASARLSALREKLAAEADALFTPRKSAGKTFYLSRSSGMTTPTGAARGDS